MTGAHSPSTIVLFTLLFVHLFMPNTAIAPHDLKPASAIRAYLGGSFDPVHKGHLQMAMVVYQHLLPIAEQQQRDLHVSLLPNARSPFKTHSTDPEHRLTMLKLATQNTPLQIHELELWQAPPVYTIDSVCTLRQRYPNDSLIFIMGMDSARSLGQWKDGLKLTDYVNLWIFSRHSMNSTSDTYNDFRADILVEEDLTKQDTFALQAQLPAPLQKLIVDSPTALLLPTSRTLTDSSALKSANKGHIYIDHRPVVAVSSTQIRQQLQSTENWSNIMPSAKTQITSVTPINAIISNTTSNSFAKWLNPAVYHYIIAHQLYSAAQFR